MAPPHPKPYASASQVPILVLLAGLMVLAPLFNGGLDPLPTLLLQGLALLIIGLTLWRTERPTLGYGEILLLGALLVLPLLYLIPWPAELHALLPGRAVYAQALASVDPAAAAGARPLSLHPYATESAWLMTLIPIGTFLGVRALTERQAQQLTYLLLTIATLQVLIGLFQFATASTGVDYTLAEWAPRGGAASGTYRNRNHLAGLLEMVFPLALALFLFHFGRRPDQSRRPQDWRGKTLAVLRAGGRPSLAFALVAIFLVVGIVVTRSRTGIAMAMLGVILTALLFTRHIGASGSFGLMGRLITLAIAFSIALGLAPVLDRFALGDMEKDARWPLASATFGAAGTLMPLGSGPGTYPDAFPAQQPLELGRWFINHAHNDYLEALYESGLGALALLAIFLVLMARHWPQLLAGEEWSRFRCLQIGAGVGMTLLLGHSFTDYNLHTPANLAFFGFLAGLFFAPPGRLPITERKQRRERRTRNMDRTLPETPLATALGPAPRQSNPFDD